MKPKIIVLVLFFLIIVLARQTNGHVEQSKDPQALGIDEKLGQTIPLDLNFNDESGNRVGLWELIHKPTILAPVYYHCPNVCSLLLQNLADVLNRLPSEPGKEYVVLAFSFDETEKPALALERKKLYLKMIERPFPEDAWRFLTGDRENIHKLTDGIGFHFKRVGDDFEHPVSLIILSPEGKIVRYMYGADPLPFDLKLALVEASQGRIGPTIVKVVRFCFSYDPKANKLVFNLLKVTGSVTLVFTLLFVGFLFFKGRKRLPKEEQQG
ncbi:MAG: SCO family protein [Thermodesulfobacteriota bacterium]